MSEFDFILNNIIYSFSSVNTYETCPFAFKNIYILAKERKGNFYSAYGSFCHNILEKYFKDELEIWDLSKYFENNFGKEITEIPPPYPKNIVDIYYQDGLNFFENFEFDKNKYEIILIEDKIESKHKDFKLVVKPDLVLKDKTTNEYILMDYKTKKLKNNKYDEETIEEYKKQFYLYAYYIFLEKQITVSKILIWFIRNNQLVELPIDHYQITNVLDWFESIVTKIKQETEWKMNNNKKNQYYCSQLCGLRDMCEHKIG
jgi:CRISPR/Cas system-associated exonuclease Cas4 (RecB family)